MTQLSNLCSVSPILKGALKFKIVAGKTAFLSILPRSPLDKCILCKSNFPRDLGKRNSPAKQMDLKKTPLHRTNSEISL